ncbi:MAG: GAF domain-containing protein [Selenomonadaceae bacterium]
MNLQKKSAAGDPCSKERQEKITECSIFSQRKRFLTTRTEIMDSWERCDKAGLKSHGKRNPPQLALSEFELMVNNHCRLITIARPFMKSLYRMVAGSGFVVVLADERGYIMEVLGDADMLQKPLTKHFHHGAAWEEKVAGTNAIGTVLVLQQPFQVTGPEHYCQMHHGLTCAAAPIFATDGSFLGVIDLSGHNVAKEPLALTMVEVTAKAIMTQLSAQRTHEIPQKKYFGLFHDKPLLDKSLTGRSFSTECIFAFKAAGPNFGVDGEKCC